MYQVNHVVKLDGKKFYDVSLWNMFCRKKALSIMLLIVYAVGLSTIATAMPALRSGNTNGFIMNAGIGIIVLIMTLYMTYNNISRLKRSSRNEEFLAKTEKHIKMDEDQIINYRVSVSEQISYKWDQVVGVYDLKDDVVFCMKDEQILLLEKSKLETKELEFIRAKADVRMLWKKSAPMALWLVIAAVVTVVCVAVGVTLYFG
ncbi:MAG: hypothetical protein IJ468_11795 [Lachnospiraceae bacterium]|nr:hypothetical protein [Lachnospiraceae bacterium]